MLLSRVIKRTRQFYRAVFSGMGPADYALAEKWLNKTEKKLFYGMEPAVQKHCVNVARMIMETADKEIADKEIVRDNLIRAALIHDIGKLNGTFTLIDRILFVLGTRVSTTLVSRVASPRRHGIFGGLRYAFFIHLNHEAIGADMAKKSGLPAEMIYLIKNHHNRCEAQKSAELAVLLSADEQN